MNPGGSMTGGSSAKSAGVLSRANELKRLEQEREKLLDTQSDYKKSLQQAQSQLAETEYEIKTIGAELREVDLKIKDGYKLDLSEVRAAADKNTKAILFTNPNNPTGSVLSLEEMRELVEIAKSVDAWIICDEMYRGLDEEYMPSFADLYDKAIVTASSSKIYSLAGLSVTMQKCAVISLTGALMTPSAAACLTNGSSPSRLSTSTRSSSAPAGL